MNILLRFIVVVLQQMSILGVSVNILIDITLTNTVSVEQISFNWFCLIDFNSVVSLIWKYYWTRGAILLFFWFLVETSSKLMEQSKWLSTYMREPFCKCDSPKHINTRNSFPSFTSRKIISSCWRRECAILKMKYPSTGTARVLLSGKNKFPEAGIIKILIY